MRLINSLVLSSLLHGLILFLLLGDVAIPLSPFLAWTALDKNVRFLSATLSPLTKRIETSPEAEQEKPVVQVESKTQDTGKTGEIPSVDTSKHQPSTIDEPTSRQEAAHYYSRREVDYPPRMIESLTAKNGPLDLALTGYDEQGSAVFEIWINETGSIDHIAGANNGLSEATYGVIKATVALTTFIPAHIDGRRVKCKIVVEIEVKAQSKNGQNRIIEQL